MAGQILQCNSTRQAVRSVRRILRNNGIFNQLEKIIRPTGTVLSPKEQFFSKVQISPQTTQNSFFFSPTINISYSFPPGNAAVPINRDKDCRGGDAERGFRGKCLRMACAKAGKGGHNQKFRFLSTSVI